MKSFAVLVLVLSGCAPAGLDAQAVSLLALASGGDDAGVDAGAPADMAAGGVGYPCDPENDCHLDVTYAPECVGNLVCPICAAGLICTTDGICDGPRCGSGNVVCHDPTICELAGNCVPPCRDAAGAVIYDPDAVGDCEGAGERTAMDGRCYVPPWFRLCRALGGH